MASENKNSFVIDTKEKAFDCAIRDYVINNDKTQYGYKIEDRRYENYMSKNAWESFLNEMKTDYKRQFEKGGGKELEERKTRYGLYPPKMACYGSSSRLIYLCSKDIGAFSFEEILPTRVGGDANLDGYKHNESLDVYVEAKCREIYYGHSSINVSSRYIDVYDFIRKETNSDFQCDHQNEKDGYCRCVFKYKKHIIKHFDIKQLICHFLGISARILDSKFNQQTIKIRFVYLVYNPEKIKDCIDEKYRDKILKTYEETKEEIMSMGDMVWLFKAVYEFQRKELSNQHLPSFEFVLTDQDGYKNAIEKV